MILLFGEKAKTNSSSKNSNIKNHPVENSGILAMNGKHNTLSLLDMNEYDSYMFSQQAEIDYSMYSDDGMFYNTESGFMSSFANAVSVLADASADCSFASFSSGCECSCSSGSFSSVC